MKRSKPSTNETLRNVTAPEEFIDLLGGFFAGPLVRADREDRTSENNRTLGLDGFKQNRDA